MPYMRWNACVSKFRQEWDIHRHGVQMPGVWQRGQQRYGGLNMGRLLTACIITLLFFIAWIVVSVTVGIIEGLGGSRSPLHFMVYVTGIGMLFSLPIALLLNLRDWLRARSSQKKTSP